MKSIRGLLRKPLKSKAARGKGIRLRFKDGRFAPSGNALKKTFKGRTKRAFNYKNAIATARVKLRELTGSKTRNLAFEKVLESGQIKRPRAKAGAGIRQKIADRAYTAAKKLQNHNINTSSYTFQPGTNGVYAHIKGKNFNAGFKFTRKAGVVAATGSTMTAVIAKSVLDKIEKTASEKRNRKR